MSKGAWSLKVTQSSAAMLECEEGWLIGRQGEQLDWGSGEQRDRWTDRVDNAVSSSEWQGWLQGPSAWKYPHLYKTECDFLCVCQGDTKRKKYIIHSSCKMEKQGKKGMRWEESLSGAGWVPADETDVEPYWKASAQCTRAPSSTLDIWA